LLGIVVFMANYSVVSSHHRQHLHGIIEYLPPFEPDVVIFYGGYNETLQSAYYDPRPGYPYNYFYRSETKPFFKLLLENSGIIGEIDIKLKLFTNLVVGLIAPAFLRCATSVAEQLYNSIKHGKHYVKEVDHTNLRRATLPFSFHCPDRDLGVSCWTPYAQHVQLQTQLPVETFRK